MTDTIKTLELALDQDPGDMLLRLALADAYEEEGDDSLSRYYRWTARHGKWPERVFQLWRWYRSDGHRSAYFAVGKEIWEIYAKDRRAPYEEESRLTAERNMAEAVEKAGWPDHLEYEE